MTGVDYQCRPCKTFSIVPGLCPFCDEPMSAIGEQGLPPCPDWPDVDIDSASRVYRQPAAPAQTRTRRRRGER